MGTNVSSLIQQVAIGSACGFADFLFTTIAQKISMLAGVKFKEIEDKDKAQIAPAERLDKDFWNVVVLWPAGEEVVFREILQPLLSYLLLCMPQLSAPTSLGIPAAHVASSVVAGAGFGAAHYYCYESGRKQVALISTISGSFYGIIKERFGLGAPISAHMVHNFMMCLVDKHFPKFLDSSNKSE